MLNFICITYDLKTHFLMKKIIEKLISDQKYILYIIPKSRTYLHIIFQFSARDVWKEKVYIIS